MIVGGVPEALLDRLEVRQRRHRRRCRLASSDGLGERPLGTQVGRSQRRVHHALQTGLSGEFQCCLVPGYKTKVNVSIL